MSSNLLNDIKMLNEKTSSGKKFEIINKITRKIQKSNYHSNEVDIYIRNAFSTKGTSSSFAAQDMDYFNKIVLVNLIKYTRNLEGVVKLLKSENDEFVVRAIKNCPFFLSENDMSSLMKTIFPYISFSNRNLLIRQYAKLLSEEDAEKCYKILKNEFSFHAAKYLLQYCSDDFILQQVKYGVFLTVKNILSLLRERTKFVLCYLKRLFEMLKKNEKFHGSIRASQYGIVYKKLLQTSFAKEFLEIVDNYFDCIDYFPKLGMKLTKRVLAVGKVLILKNSSWYSDHLHHLTIYKYLSEDEYKAFYKGLFPKKKEDVDISSDKSKIIKHLQYYRDNKEKKLQLLIQTYREVCGKNLLDSIENLTPELMNLFDTKQRVFYAEKLLNSYTAGGAWKQLNSNFKQNDLICYLPCDQSIKQFKDQIYISSDSNKRGEYLKLMLETCKINDDMTQLLEVLKYFNQRHRNELVDVRLSFLLKLYGIFNVKKFNAEHWKEIHEILNLFIINNEMRRLWSMEELIIPYFEFNIKNNLPTEECMRMFIVYSSKWSSWFKLRDFIKKHPNVSNKLIVQYSEMIQNYDVDAIDFIKLLYDYNQNNQNDIISLVNYSWACDKIDELIKLEDSYSLEFLYKYLKYDKQASDKYLEKVKKLQVGKIEDFIWYMNDNPDSIYSNFKNFCEGALSPYILKKYTLPLLKTRKIQKYLVFENKFRNFCLNIVKDNSNLESTKKTSDNAKIQSSGDNNEIENENIETRKESGQSIQNQDENDENYKYKYKGSVFRILSYLLEPEEYFELIEKYLPEKERIEVSEINSDIIYSIQTSIAISLKQFNNYHRTFDVLRKFCCGDYLKITVGSLNSLCMKTSHYKTKEFLDSCLDTPVSFKKHVIRLELLISGQEYIVELLKNLWKNEKNPSIREIVIQKIFNYFVTESENTEYWKLLKETIQMLTTKDESALKWITKYEVVPVEYVREYIELIWLKLSDLQNQKLDIHCFKSNLVIFLQESLNSELYLDPVIVKIIKENLFENYLGDLEIQNYLGALSVRLILKLKDTQEQGKYIDELIVKKIKKVFNENCCKEVSTEDELKDLKEAKSLIISLLRTFCDVAVEKRKKYDGGHLILSIVKDRLSKVFDSSLHFYAIFIQMELTVIFLQVGDSFRNFGKNIRKVIDSEVDKYETYIVPHLQRIMKEFLSSIENVDYKNMIYEIISGLLELPLQSINCVLLAINLIDTDTLYKKKYVNILEYLRSIDDKRVQLCLNSV